MLEKHTDDVTNNAIHWLFVVTN